jgi:ABC-type uncharacterized transport system permease subunit
LDEDESKQEPEINDETTIPIKAEVAFYKTLYHNIINKLKDPEFHKTVAWTIGSIILAFLIATIAMIMSGYNPLLAFVALILGAATHFDRVLWYATPLIFTGLSVAFAFKCGLFNIGPEGQLYMGAMAATLVGYMIALPIVVHQLAALIIGTIVGGLWGLLPGILKAYRGAHEVVTTMMMSYIAILFTQWLVTFPLKEPGEYQWIAQTPPLLETALLPKLGSAFLHAGLLIALLTVFVIDFLINKTVIGYEMRAVGLNQEAAETAGIDPKKNIAFAIGIAGALAGLGGACEILGYHHKFQDGWSTGLGWDGITVAVLGGNNPYGVLAGAIFFGILRAGGLSMQRLADVPLEMVSLIQGLIVVFIAAPKAVNWLANRGVDYAQWLKDDTAPAATHLSTTITTGISAILGITLYTPFMVAIEARAPGSGAAVALIFLLIIILSLYAFADLMMQGQRGLLMAVFASIGWTLIAIISLMVGSISPVTQSLIIGLILLVLSIILMKVFPNRITWERKVVEVGGED